MDKIIKKYQVNLIYTIIIKINTNLEDKISIILRIISIGFNKTELNNKFIQNMLQDNNDTINKLCNKMLILKIN